MDDTPQKYCRKCEKFKPATLDYFHADKRSPGGLAGWCKICRTTYNKTPREKDIEQKRQYRATDKFRQWHERYKKTDAFKINRHNRDIERRARKRDAIGAYTE